MKDKVLALIRQCDMIAPGDTVVVGVSGGADSMCLLHLLCSLRLELSIQVIAAHLNHMLRGNDAVRDEEYVRTWCEKAHIRCEVRRVPIAGLAKSSGMGEEECGRAERYRFFQEIAGPLHAKIATAHTLSDQTETVLFHLTRGTGSRGLCGIPPMRENIIRPLLACTRRETEEYCRMHQVIYWPDQTNDDIAFSRNRIRAQVIPELEKINPAFQEAVRRMTVQLTAQEAYLEAQERQLLRAAALQSGYSLPMLRNVPSFLAVRALLHEAVRNGAADPDFAAAERIDALLMRGSGAVVLHGGISLRCSNAALQIFCEKEKTQNVEEEIAVHAPGSAQLLGRTFRFLLYEGKFFWNTEKIYKNFLSRSVDYDTITAYSVLRNRRSGDLFAPAKRNVTKSLKKLFNEAHIPPESRAQYVMLANGENVLWIEGFGASECAVPTANSEKILVILEENGNGEFSG